MLLCGFASCTKETKTVTVPKVGMHLLTVHSANGTTRKMLPLDKDLTLTISTDQKEVQVTEADGSQRALKMTPASEMDPKIKAGIEKLIREEDAGKGKPLSTALPAKGGNWKDVAYHLQNGYKNDL